MKEPDRHLFLSEYSGTPISGKVLYKAWTEVSFLPIKEWHPQLMRHYWAVTTLWNERCKAISVLRQQNQNVIVTGDWITGTAQSDLETIIQPQLGHVDVKTTRAYLVWIRQMYDVSEKHDAWIRHLETSREDFEDENS
jgi:integrase